MYFLEKMFVGDGCDTNTVHKYRMISYTTVSKELAVQIFNLLLKIGCLSSICKNRDAYVISVTGEHCEKLSKIFNWKSKFKYGKLKNSKAWLDEDGNAIIPVKYCSKIESDEKYVYNIEVSEDHTYCTSFIVHNCEQKGDWLDTFGRADIITT